jgi:hypothetical protein
VAALGLFVGFCVALKCIYSTNRPISSRSLERISIQLVPVPSLGIMRGDTRKKPLKVPSNFPCMAKIHQDEAAKMPYFAANF